MQQQCCGWLKMQKTMQHDQPDPDSMPSDELLLAQQNRESRQQAFIFILAQLAGTVVLSALWLVNDLTQAYSSLAGGLIATLANAWLALKVFREKVARRAIEQPEYLLATFYTGEIYKFVFTGAMFVMAFVLIRPVSVVALLITYFLVHLTPAVVNTFAGLKTGTGRKES